MIITATELKLNLGKYLDAANDEVIVITKNGKAIANLVGTYSYKYDLSELEEFDKKINEGLTLSETNDPLYNSDGSKQPEDFWALTLNGEPVAQLKPILKEKPKRKLGFIDCPPSSDETTAALLAPVMSDEEYEEWLNEKW